MKTKTITSIDSLHKAFIKIYQGLGVEFVSRIEQEMIQLVPSEDSSVFLKAGYSENENTLSLNVYVSNPQKDPKEIHFSEIIYQWLIKADVENLPLIQKYILLMEAKKGDSYDIDAIPAIYTEQLKEYYLRFVVSK